MKVNKKFIRSITSICAATTVFVSCLLLPVSAAEIIDNNGMSYMMAFAGSDNTGLNYLSSGFIEYSVNDDFILYSPNCTGTFTSDSFLSSVIYLKNTDDTYILHEGDSFKYSFSDFGFNIEYNGATYSASVLGGAKIIFTYEDNTTLEVEPDFEFNSVTRRMTLFGESHVSKNVKEIKLDCKFFPSSVGLSGTLHYMYYMMYPPDVSIELLSRESEILGDINENINSAINGTPEQNQQAQDAVGGLNSSTDKLGQLGDQMSSVEKPTIDSNSISAGSLVPQTSLVVLSSPFQALWENHQLLAMLTIVVTLVLVSWVFFGKKG